MKKLVQISLLLFFAFTLCTCLKVKEPEPLTLPPITMEGKNTMGCIINGELFTVSGKQLRGGWDHRGTHANFVSNSYITLSAKQEKTFQAKVYIRVKINEDQSIYELNNKELSVGMVRMWVDDHIFADIQFSTNNEHKGHLEVLKLERNLETGEGFVSGLFEFDAIDSRGDVIEVREGRFDMSFGW